MKTKRLAPMRLVFVGRCALASGLASPAQTRRTVFVLASASLALYFCGSGGSLFLLGVLGGLGVKFKGRFYRRRMVTPPFVVITRTRAPPDPRVVVNRSLRRPWTVIG